MWEDGKTRTLREKVLFLKTKAASLKDILNINTANSSSALEAEHGAVITLAGHQLGSLTVPSCLLRALPFPLAGGDMPGALVPRRDVLLLSELGTGFLVLPGVCVAEMQKNLTSRLMQYQNIPFYVSGSMSWFGCILGLQLRFGSSFSPSAVPSWSYEGIV